jgi:hypothetical protein
MSTDRAAGDQNVRDARDAGSLGEITAEDLRAVFPQ